MTVDDQARPDSSGPGLDRRAAMKAALGGAAAAAVLNGPRVQGFSVAPGYAAMATPRCTATVVSPWAHAHTPATWQGGSGGLGLFGGAGQPTLPSDYNTMGPGTTAAPIHLVEADPPAGTYTYDSTTGYATLTAQVTLTPHSIFTFAFSYRWRDTSNHVATQRVRAEYSTSATAPIGSWTSAGNVVQSNLTSTAANFWSPSSAGETATSFQISTVGLTTSQTYYVRLRHSFQGTITTALTQRANDIAITIPTITCA